MYTCPSCGKTGWFEHNTTHADNCSLKGKSSQAATSSTSALNQKAEQLIENGNTVTSGIFFGNKQQLLQQEQYVAQGAESMESVHPAVVPLSQTPPIVIPEPEPPKREWGRILDDIAEFVASTLSASWDVAAAYMAIDGKDQEWLLLSSNSATTINLAMIGEGNELSFTATSKKAEYNPTPRKPPSRGEIISLPDTEQDYTPTGDKGAIQSLARLIEAKQNSGIYGVNKLKIERIMAAITAGRIYCIPACNIDPEMHAEIKIINYVWLKKMRPCFKDDDYIGTSKPFCPLCYKFIQWLNARKHYDTPIIGARRFHGIVFERWTAPCFVTGEPAEELQTYLKEQCTLVKPVKLTGCRCQVCRQPHPIYKPNIAGRGRTTLNVKSDIGATDDIVRSRSPTRDLRKQFS